MWTGAICRASTTVDGCGTDAGRSGAKGLSGPIPVADAQGIR